MSRITLGLFGAKSSSFAGQDRTHAAEAPLAVEHRERLAGLTPVERAAAEAMIRGAATA